MGVPHWDLMGTPIRTGSRYPPPLGLDGDTPCQDWMGTPSSPIRTGWGYPPPFFGRSGDRAAARRAVCLLRSGRRTILYFSNFWFSRAQIQKMNGKDTNIDKEITKITMLTILQASRYWFKVVHTMQG